MMSRRQLQGMARTRQPKPEMIRFGGGLDLVTPPLALPAGFVRKSLNWECDVNGGYARIQGYERFDGRSAPSSATAFVLGMTLTGALSVGDTVTGVTSAATGKVIAVTSTTVVLTQVPGTHSGTFVTAEVLNVGGNPQATTTSAAMGASSALLAAQYKNLAADARRANIAVPVGSGNSLGGVRLNGVTYTWRNNAGATAANLWKSTSAGWVQVTLYNEVRFTVGGATEPAEGATLTQGGVTATIKRVVATTAFAAWATNTAAGRLIITNPAGGNFAAGAATIGAINVTLSAVQTAIVLLPSGRYQCIKTNFGGTVQTRRVYGCDGVNRGFEFDGDVLVPITTGMTSDIPTHVVEHMKHLFFGFGASSQHSGPGTPYIWSVVLGAGEIALGDTITGYQSMSGSVDSGALAIFGATRIRMLYGTGVSNWNLVTYRDDIGAIRYSNADVGHAIFLDAQGLRDLAATPDYANFGSATLSARVRTWLVTQRTKVTACCLSRDKSQYRLFFSDGYALFVTFSGRKIIGMMQILFPNPVLWAESSRETNGSETMFFGSSNGMVYQMDIGTSCDGADLVHTLSLAWDHSGSPRTIKHYFDCMFEMAGAGYAEFFFGYSLGYGSSNVSQPAAQLDTVSFSPAQWDSGIDWDTSGAKWDGQALLPSVFPIGGEAENISLSLRGSSDYHEAIKVSGAVIHHTPRRELR